MNHDEVTRMIGGAENYGKGIKPNPFVSHEREWQRRKDNAATRALLTEKIEMIFEPRFITPPPTSELIESIVTASDSRSVLELGTCTGFTSMHILRAIVGKEGAHLTSVDARPAHDREFFNRPELAPYFTFVQGWTPGILSTLEGKMFSLVFIDSDHSVSHTVAELEALWKITSKGTIFLAHDLPEWQSPEVRQAPPIRDYLFQKVKDGTFQGGIIPTCEQLDCLDAWGKGYPPQCNPHLGFFVRL